MDFQNGNEIFNNKICSYIDNMKAKINKLVNVLI